MQETEKSSPGLLTWAFAAGVSPRALSWVEPHLRHRLLGVLSCELRVGSVQPLSHCYTAVTQILLAPDRLIRSCRPITTQSPCSGHCPTGPIGQRSSSCAVLAGKEDCAPGAATLNHDNPLPLADSFLERLRRTLVLLPFLLGLFIYDLSPFYTDSKDFQQCLSSCFTDLFWGNKLKKVDFE